MTSQQSSSSASSSSSIDDCQMFSQEHSSASSNDFEPNMNSPLQQPAILRHVLKYCVNAGSFHSAAKLVKVNTTFRDTLMQYSQKTLRGALCGSLSDLEVVDFFQRVCVSWDLRSDDVLDPAKDDNTRMLREKMHEAQPKDKIELVTNFTQTVSEKEHHAMQVVECMKNFRNQRNSRLQNIDVSLGQDGEAIIFNNNNNNIHHNGDDAEINDDSLPHVDFAELGNSNSCMRSFTFYPFVSTEIQIATYEWALQLIVDHWILDRKKDAKFLIHPTTRQNELLIDHAFQLYQKATRHETRLHVMLRSGSAQILFERRTGNPVPQSGAARVPNAMVNCSPIRSAVLADNVPLLQWMFRTFAANQLCLRNELLPFSCSAQGSRAKTVELAVKYASTETLKLVCNAMLRELERQITTSGEITNDSDPDQDVPQNDEQQGRESATNDDDNAKNSAENDTWIIRAHKAFVESKRCLTNTSSLFDVPGLFCSEGTINSFRPIFSAACLNKTDMAKYLLEKCRCCPNALLTCGQAPLQGAIANLNVQMIKMLVNANQHLPPSQVETKKSSDTNDAGDNDSSSAVSRRRDFQTLSLCMTADVESHDTENPDKMVDVLSNAYLHLFFERTDQISCSSHFQRQQQQLASARKAGMSKEADTAEDNEIKFYLKDEETKAKRIQQEQRKVFDITQMFFGLEDSGRDFHRGKKKMWLDVFIVNDGAKFLQLVALDNVDLVDFLLCTLVKKVQTNPSNNEKELLAYSVVSKSLEAALQTAASRCNREMMKVLLNHLGNSASRQDGQSFELTPEMGTDILLHHVSSSFSRMLTAAKMRNKTTGVDDDDNTDENNNNNNNNNDENDDAAARSENEITFSTTYIETAKYVLDNFGLSANQDFTIDSLFGVPGTEAKLSGDSAVSTICNDAPKNNSLLIEYIAKMHPKNESTTGIFDVKWIIQLAQKHQQNKTSSSHFLNHSRICPSSGQQKTALDFATRKLNNYYCDNGYSSQSISMLLRANGAKTAAEMLAITQRQLLRGVGDYDDGDDDFTLQERQKLARSFLESGARREREQPNEENVGASPTTQKTITDTFRLAPLPLSSGKRNSIKKNHTNTSATNPFELCGRNNNMNNSGTNKSGEALVSDVDFSTNRLLDIGVENAATEKTSANQQKSSWSVEANQNDDDDECNRTQQANENVANSWSASKKTTSNYFDRILEMTAKSRVQKSTAPPQ